MFKDKSEPTFVAPEKIEAAKQNIRMDMSKLSNVQRPKGQIEYCLLFDKTIDGLVEQAEQEPVDKKIKLLYLVGYLIKIKCDSIQGT